MPQTVSKRSNAIRPAPLGRTLERAFFEGLVAGVDEVGRGALAGPVVVAAVVLGAGSPDGLADSKLLSARRRNELVEELRSCGAEWGVGMVEAVRIDEVGIMRALAEAATAALNALPRPPWGILLDGPHDYIGGAWNVQTAVRGDQTEACIAAASVVAKVTRDRIMHQRDEVFPGYGFASHVGYGTVAHRDAIRSLGPCQEHRLSWRLLPEQS